MTLEERIVRELKAERRAVPHAVPAGVPARITKRRVAVGVAVFVAVALGVVAFLGIGGPAPSPVVEGPDGTLLLTIDGSVTVPVTGPFGTLEGFGGEMPLYRGAGAPALENGFVPGGEEQPLSQGEPVWPNVSVGEVPVVYIGSPDGIPVFLSTNGTIGWLERMRARMQGSEIGPHICLTIGREPDQGAGFCGNPIELGTGETRAMVMGGSYHAEDGSALQWYATYVDVPAGTAVVTMATDSEVAAWQRPAGEVAVFFLDELPRESITLSALDAGGEELASDVVPAAWFGG